MFNNVRTPGGIELTLSFADVDHRRQPVVTRAVHNKGIADVDYDTSARAVRHFGFEKRRKAINTFHAVLDHPVTRWFMLKY